MLEKLSTSIRQSIVAKSTLKILAAAFLVALIAAAIAIISANHYQKTHITQRIEQLATTVESTARIAAFTNDTQLANEVSIGLLTNHIVKKVEVISHLDNKAKTLSSLPTGAQTEEESPHINALYSPFKDSEKVGELRIWLDESLVKKQANAYAEVMALIIFVTLTCITAILSWVIYQSITKPIKSIADEIHELKLDDDSLVLTPSGHEEDEIGRLVKDTNELISRSKKLIQSEHRLHVKHASSEQRLRMIFKQSQTGILVMDTSLNVTSFNSALLKMLNLNPRDFKNNHTNIPLDILFPAHEDTFKKVIAKAVKQVEPVNFTFSIDDTARKQKWLEVSILAIDNNQIQGIFNDITSHKMATLKAIKIAERDPLTNLLNRRGFEPKLDLLMQHTITPPSIALLILDLDGFKQINDTHGHDAGDFLLKSISKQILNSVRKDDLVARLGGDEFAIVVDSIELPELAYRVAEKIIEKAAKPVQFNNLELNVGASIGIALASAQSNTSELLIKHADEAMYMAKQAGKSRYHLYNS